MNNPNPFVPQGSLLEQHKRRSRMKIAVFCIVAASVAGLTGMLIEGCKREETAENNNSSAMDTNNAEVDTNTSPMVVSNPPVVVPPLPTNQPVITPPVTSVIPSQETGATYVVVKGDTLGKIAKKNGVSLKALEEANPGVTPTKLKVGQKLQIPAGGSATPATTSTATSTDMSGGETYTIKSGDTLSKIAKAHGVSLKALKAANPNVDPNHIKVGHKLNIPAKAESAPAATPLPPVSAPAAPAPVSNPAPVAAPGGQ